MQSFSDKCVKDLAPKQPKTNDKCSEHNGFRVTQHALINVSTCFAIINVSIFTRFYDISSIKLLILDSILRSSFLFWLIWVIFSLPLLIDSPTAE